MVTWVNYFMINGLAYRVVTGMVESDGLMIGVVFVVLFMVGYQFDNVFKSYKNQSTT